MCNIHNIKFVSYPCVTYGKVRIRTEDILSNSVELQCRCRVTHIMTHVFLLALVELYDHTISKFNLTTGNLPVAFLPLGMNSD